MNKTKLANALREKVDRISASAEVIDSETSDTLELVRVLARVIEGKPLARAFGAPGDWGYGTPIGDALAAPPEPGE